MQRRGMAGEAAELCGRDQAEGHVLGDVAAVGGRRAGAALADDVHRLMHLRGRAVGHAEGEVQVLEDRAHVQAERRGDGEPLAVEFLQQAADIGRHALGLAPRLGLFHARHVAERDTHVDRRIEIAECDGEQASPVDEAIAEQRLAKREAFGTARGRQRREIDRLAHRVDLHLGEPGLAAAQQRGAPGDDGHRDATGGEQAREIERAERGMRTHDHGLRCRHVRCDRVEDMLVTVGRQGDQDHVGAGCDIRRAGRDARRERALDRTGGNERLAGGQRLGACTRRRPQAGGMSGLFEKRRHSEGDRARADDADLHVCIPILVPVVSTVAERSEAKWRDLLSTSRRQLMERRSLRSALRAPVEMTGGYASLRSSQSCVRYRAPISGR